MGVVNIAKNLGIQHNVTFRVLDMGGELVSEHKGHNMCTNSLLMGIGHYLKGDGVFNQAGHMLSTYIPRYISLGTMGLISQESDSNGLPIGIGVIGTDINGNQLDEETRFKAYMDQIPGYGADGYDLNLNNNREYAGLGPLYANRDSVGADEEHTVRCELVSNTFPRASIVYREIIPETYAELSETIDVVYSAMISTGALAQFREPGKDYIYITEAGLWANAEYVESGSNGLLAAYRIVPPDENHWDMSIKSNRDLLKREIIRVGINQVVQVIWKIQIGSKYALEGKS